MKRKIRERVDGTREISRYVSEKRWKKRKEKEGNERSRGNRRIMRYVKEEMGEERETEK